LLTNKIKIMESGVRDRQTEKERYRMKVALLACTNGQAEL